MRRGSACDLGLPSFLQLVKQRPFAKPKHERREEMVRNRYKGSYICIAFVLASTLSLLAQSDRVDIQRRDDLQPKVSDDGEPQLAAMLAEAPATAGVSDRSDLPDAPSATKPDASTADPSAPAASPAIKRESHGAPVAAQGGPLWIDRKCRGSNLSGTHRWDVRRKYCQCGIDRPLLE